jgi:hypothetical protein
LTSGIAGRGLPGRCADGGIREANGETREKGTEAINRESSAGPSAEALDVGWRHQALSRYSAE